MKKALSALTLLLFLVSCSLVESIIKPISKSSYRSNLAPKTSLVTKVPASKVEVMYYRSDINSKINKIVLLPTTDFSGASTVETKDIDSLVAMHWIQICGVDKVSFAREKSGKIAKGIGGDFYAKFIRSIIQNDEIRHFANSAAIKNFSSRLVGEFGDAQFAVSVISGTEAEYNNGKSVELYIALFDPNNLTWRFITKTTITKAAINKATTKKKAKAKKVAVIDWETALKATVSSNFGEIKKINSKYLR